jgi:hypothetical protein
MFAPFGGVRFRWEGIRERWATDKALDIFFVITRRAVPAIKALSGLGSVPDRANKKL